MYRLLLIVDEGAPCWMELPARGRSGAIKRAQELINDGRAKVVIVYRKDKPTQLLTYRPVDYVHLERI